MKEVLKKISLSALMTMMVIALGFGSLVPTRALALTTGDLVKGPNSDAVYYINGTTKHVFPDRKTYMTWYTNFDTVQTVTVATLDMYTTGAPVSYRPGTKLVTHPNTARVYAVEPNAALRWIADEATAKALYGNNWATRVNDVHELTFGNYTMGASMTSSAPSKGTILKKTGDATIYYYDGTNIRPFATSAAFDANNMNAANIIEWASISGLTLGASITGAEAFATIAGVGMGTIVTGPAGTLTISLSPNTAPANGVLISSAARMPMVTVRMSAGSTDVIVDSLTITRAGLASDAEFTDFDLLNSSTMLPLNNTSKSLNASHGAVFNDDFTVAANTTMDVIVAANMCTGLNAAANAPCLADYAGEYPAISVSAMTLKNSSTLSGTLPITGNVMLTNGTIAAGTALIGYGSNNPSAATKEVGTKDYIVSSFKIKNNSSETVHTMTLESVTLTQNGSAAATDIENVRLRDTNTGTVIGTIAKPTTKKMSFTNLNKDILKGNTMNLDVLVDITGGSLRTISLDIDQKSDVVVYDQLRSVHVLPTYYASATLSGTAVSASPFYNPADTTVGNGKLRIESVSVTPTNISENKSGVLLGKFKFVMEGEIGNITALGLHVATTTTGTVLSRTDIPGDLTNLTLKDPNGNTVAGPQDPAANQANNGFTATTTDTISVPVGETIYSVYGDLSADWSANNILQIGIYPGAITMKGDLTGQTITPTPTGQIQSSSLTIKSASLAVSVSGSPAAQTIVAGAPDLEVANIVMDASSSGADVRVTSLMVPIITTGNAYPDTLSGIQIFVGSTEIPVSGRSTTYSTSGSTAAGSGTTTLTISAGNLTIPAGQSKTVRVVGDVGTGATSGTFKVGMQSGGVTAIDSEAQSFDPTYTVGQGSAMTLSAGGTLNISVAQDPKSSLVVSGTTVTVGQFVAQAKYEGMTLKGFGLSIGAPDNFISGTSYNQIETLEIWESGGSSALGSVSVSAATATVTPSSMLTMGINDSKTYLVKAKFKSVVSPSVAGSNTGMRVTLTNVDVTGTSAGSSTITQSGTNTAFKTFTSYRSIPTVTLGTVTADQMTSVGVDADLFKFSISANSAGPIGVAKFTFGVSTSTSVKIDTTGFKLYAGSSSGDTSETLSNPGDFVATQTIPTNGAAQLVVEARFDISGDTANHNAAGVSEAYIISAGTTKYFTLKGKVTAQSSSSNDDSITTVLAGDKTGVTSATTNYGGVNGGGIDGTLNADDFIWSDLNFDSYQTSTATKTYGWWNGYRVSGMDDASSTSQTQSD